MCGIVGIVASEMTDRLPAALAAIAHRGPDASCQWSDRVGRYSVHLGHARLSILDLTSAANQPFVSTDGRYVIVFNGEIFNHVELRSALTAAGVKFRTRSDTEVLLAAYSEHGMACLNSLDGMFAFVILDRVRMEVFAARDPFGIKPFYFSRESDQFAFASEVGALERASGRRFAPDRTSLAEFLLNGFLYEPNSGLVGVGKLPPAGWLRLDLRSGVLEFGTYCNPTERTTEGQRDLEAHVCRSMALQVEADVPVGLFFSGGVDSSLLLASAPRPIAALFVDYSAEEAHADRDYAGRVVDQLGVGLSVIEHAPAPEKRAEDILAEFAQVARGTEEPISDYTYSATRLISRVAREQGFKVMLSGMGGDELFAGYPRYVAARQWHWLHSLAPVLEVAGRALRRVPSWSKKADRLVAFAGSADFLAAYTQLVGYFSFDEVARLIGRNDAADRFLARLIEIDRPAAHLSWLKRAMHLDRYGFLPHNLCVTDRASMAHGLEVRVPLITQSIAAWAMAQGDSALLVRGTGKLPLRTMLSSRISRDTLARPKVGFNPPLDRKISAIGRDGLREVLVQGSLVGLLDTAIIDSWIDEHFTSVRNHTYRLWQLCYLSMWLKCHAD